MPVFVRVSMVNFVLHCVLLFDVRVSFQKCMFPNKCTWACISRHKGLRLKWYVGRQYVYTTLTATKQATGRIINCFPSHFSEYCP